MKRIPFFPLFITVIIATSCENDHDGNETQKKFPKPGTVIASAVIPVKDDTLNNFSFSVKVIADSDVSLGVYDVDVDYGPNFAEGKFTMPKGGEELIPVIRTGPASNFIIGFKVPGDTTFYDYFEVAASKGSTRMQYIKAYTF